MKRGFTCGAFAPLHHGHIRMLKEAASVCDHLTVGLQDDPTIDRPYTKWRPVLSVLEREEILEAIRYVDRVVIYRTEEDLLRLLRTEPIDVRIIGADYVGRRFTGDELDIEIHYNQRNHSFSSTEYRRLIRELS